MARTKRAQALVEYVILLALTLMVAVAVMALAGPQVASTYQRVTGALANPLALLVSSPTPTPTVMPVSGGEPPGPIATPEPTTVPSPTRKPAAKRSGGDQGQHGEQGGRGDDAHGHHRD